VLPDDEPSRPAPATIDPPLPVIGKPAVGPSLTGSGSSGSSTTTAAAAAVPPAAATTGKSANADDADNPFSFAAFKTGGKSIFDDDDDEGGDDGGSDGVGNGNPAPKANNPQQARRDIFGSDDSSADGFEELLGGNGGGGAPAAADDDREAFASDDPEADAWSDDDETDGTGPQPPLNHGTVPDGGSSSTAPAAPGSSTRRDCRHCTALSKEVSDLRRRLKKHKDRADNLDAALRSVREAERTETRSLEALVASVEVKLGEERARADAAVAELERWKAGGGGGANGGGANGGGANGADAAELRARLNSAHGVSALAVKQIDDMSRAARTALETLLIQTGAARDLAAMLRDFDRVVDLDQQQSR
jgi:hypothetical protein